MNSPSHSIAHLTATNTTNTGELSIHNVPRRTGAKKNGTAAHFKGQVGALFAATVCTFLGLVGVSAWNLVPTKMNAASEATKEMVIDVPYQEFRTVLVREDVTDAILTRLDCELIEETLLERKIDVSKDRRPLLNAILRKSRAGVIQKKRLAVKINRSDLGAKQLNLIQNVKIENDRTCIEHWLETSAGSLVQYETVIHAHPFENKTKVSMILTAEYEAEICKLVHDYAKRCVKNECEKSLHLQCEALSAFIERHAEN